MALDIRTYCKVLDRGLGVGWVPVVLFKLQSFANCEQLSSDQQEITSLLQT